MSPMISSSANARRPPRVRPRRNFAWQTQRHGTIDRHGGFSTVGRRGFNLLLSIFVLPRLDFSFLAQERWGGTSLAAVAGVWSVAVALAAASTTLIISIGDVSPTFGPVWTPERTQRCYPFCRRKPRRIWRGRCRTPRLRTGAGLGPVDRRRTTRFARDCHEYSRRLDGFGVRRVDYCPRCTRRDIFATCQQKPE